MKTLVLTSKDFDQNGKYIGAEKSLETYEGFDGNVEIEENLGWKSFERIVAKGYILANAGSGIKAGEGIKAGWV